MYSIQTLEDEGIVVIQDFGNLSSSVEASHPRRTDSTTPL
jgi:hypothetical protein